MNSAAADRDLQQHGQQEQERQRREVYRVSRLRCATRQKIYKHLSIVLTSVSTTTVVMPWDAVRHTLLMKPAIAISHRVGALKHYGQGCMSPPGGLRWTVSNRAALTGKHDTLVRRAPGWQGAPDGQQAKN